MCKAIKELCPSVKHIQLGGNFITRISSLIGNLHPFWNYIDSMLLYDGEENLSSFYSSWKTIKITQTFLIYIIWMIIEI